MELNISWMNKNVSRVFKEWNDKIYDLGQEELNVPKQNKVPKRITRTTDLHVYCQ